QPVNSLSANFTNSAITPHTNLLQQVSVYQTVNSFTGVYHTVNSFTGGSAREFALRKFHEFSHHTPHQPASAGFGISDREFIHGVYQTVNSFTGVYQTVNSFTGRCIRP
ncbi:MAG: hypothetical protein WBE17_08425, partial [Anaerolineae bacterium]